MKRQMTWICLKLPKSYSLTMLDIIHKWQKKIDIINEIWQKNNSAGRKQDAPQKGINIIRYSDGTTRKVLIK